MEATNSPKLYVGTFGKYASGSIAGAWLNLNDYADSDGFYDACKKLHSDEHDPELMFQDFENFPKFLYSECGNVEEIYEWLQYDNWERKAIEAWLNDICDQPVSDWQEIIDHHHGIWESEQEFAWHFVEECDGFNDIPEHLQCYFDCERYAYSLFINAFTTAYDSAGNMHVFARH